MIIGYLTAGMDACIGSAGAGQFNGISHHCRKHGFDAALDCHIG